MLPYYASVLLLKKKLLKADIHQVVGSEIWFFKSKTICYLLPDTWVEPFNQFLCLILKKENLRWSKKKRKCQSKKKIDSTTGNRPKYRFPWGKALIKKLESSNISLKYQFPGNLPFPRFSVAKMMTSLVTNLTKFSSVKSFID